MSTINLFETTKIIKIRDILQHNNPIANPMKIDHLISVFPFHQLVEVAGMHHDMIIVICNILVHIVENNGFITHSESVQYTIDFIFRNLSFLMKNNDCGDTLYAVLDLLRLLLFRLKYSKTVTIKFEIILKIIKQVLKSSAYMQDKFIHCCADLYIGILGLGSINYEDTAEFVECTAQLINCVTDTFTIFKIDNAILWARRVKIIPELEIMYLIADTNIGRVHKNVEINIITEFLKCIASIYEICRTKKILQSITNQLAPKFDIICTYIKMEEYKLDCSKIMQGVIENIFYDTPWMNSDLMTEIKILAESQYWNYRVKTDLILVIYYLEFMYLNFSHNPAEIIRTIKTRCQDTTSTNPPVIKSAYLLYSAYAYAANSNTRYLEPNLLMSLQNSQQLAEMLTYHKSQLIWILWNGSLLLKYKVLNLWIKNHKDDKDILDSIKSCQESKLLIHFILKVPDDEDRKRSVDLLSKLEDSEIPKLLMESLPRAICNHAALSAILSCNPSLPEDDKLSTIIVHELSRVLPKVTDESCIKMICTYSIQILCKLRDKVCVYAFFDSITVKFLLKICLNNDGGLSLIVLQLLKIIVRLQGRHQRAAKESISVDFSEYVKGGLRHKGRLKMTLQLLQTIIRSKHTPLIILQSPALNLYFALLSLRNSELSEEVYKTIIYLFRLQNCLATSMHNIFVVKFECSNISDHKSGFVSFLRCWLSIVSVQDHCQLPVSHIKTFLTSLGNNYQSEVQIISNILNKWQASSPPVPTEY